MSLHMKATMMKVSDPIIFGHCIKVYFKDVFTKYAQVFQELGINANNGLGDVYDKIKGHPMELEIKTDINAVYAKRPGLAMVNSSKGITNLFIYKRYKQLSFHKVLSKMPPRGAQMFLSSRFMFFTSHPNQI